MASEVVKLVRLAKHYPMGDTVVQALRGVSFSLRHGDYLAIMGHSGSGKSTLLNILGCLDTPTSGEYLVDGLNAAVMNDRELSALRCRKFGFIFQSFNLIPQLTVLENIEVPLFYLGWHAHASRKRGRELAGMVGLSTRLSHRPAQLSGGQCQRVAIARALANDPAVILADEPTGNLDSATGVEIMTLLDGLVVAGRTVILVTHESDIAAHAHRVIHLADGQIVKDEPNP